VPAYLIPAPAVVLDRVASDAALLLRHGGVTTFEAVGGFLLSLVVSQSFPKVAPLIIIWFGLGIAPKLLIGFLVAFFPVVISTIAGMRSVETDMIDLARRKTVLFITHSISEAVFLGDRVVVMTPRPGRIARVIDVDLPRPRDFRVIEHPAFTAAVRAVRELLDAAAMVE